MIVFIIIIIETSHLNDLPGRLSLVLGDFIKSRALGTKTLILILQKIEVYVCIIIYLPTQMTRLLCLRLRVFMPRLYW